VFLHLLITPTKTKKIFVSIYRHINIKTFLIFFSVTKKFTTSSFFGDGRSAAKLLKILKSKKIWKINNQKQFRDIASF
jgi:hypothetical protein